MKSTETNETPAPVGPNLTVVETPTNLESTLNELNTLRTQYTGLEKHLAMVTTSRDALETHLKKLQENEFHMAMTNLDGGQVVLDAGDLLRGICEKVQRVQKKGVLTLKLTVEPLNNMLTIKSDLTATPPKENAPVAMFYADENGHLSRQDPRQREFGFDRRAQ